MTESQYFQPAPVTERLTTQLEVIFIENHPDHRASGMSAEALIRWGERMGLISQQEAEAAA